MSASVPPPLSEIEKLRQEVSIKERAIYDEMGKLYTEVKKPLMRPVHWLLMGISAAGGAGATVLHLVQHLF